VLWLLTAVLRSRESLGDNSLYSDCKSYVFAAVSYNIHFCACVHMERSASTCIHSLGVNAALHSVGNDIRVFWVTCECRNSNLVLWPLFPITQVSQYRADSPRKPDIHCHYCALLLFVYLRLQRTVGSRLYKGKLLKSLATTSFRVIFGLQRSLLQIR